jgi:hypothetical protein
MYGFQGIGPGWLPVMERLCIRLQSGPKSALRLISVKEKLGSLRISFRGGDNAIGEAVNAAKIEAMVTCDQCGAAGALRDMDGLLAVRCKKCEVG